MSRWSCAIAAAVPDVSHSPGQHGNGQGVVTVAASRCASSSDVRDNHNPEQPATIAEDAKQRNDRGSRVTVAGSRESPARAFSGKPCRGRELGGRHLPTEYRRSLIRANGSLTAEVSRWATANVTAGISRWIQVKAGMTVGARRCRGENVSGENIAADAPQSRYDGGHIAVDACQRP
jgi:hypothetical protein